MRECERETTTKVKITEVEFQALRPGEVYASLGDQISAVVLEKGRWKTWLQAASGALILFLTFLVAIAYLLWRGVGIWGINIPVAWGFAITNFVWWIGIGHAGTFISAILLLLHQTFRSTINRFAEAMTLFAVACAGLFPLLHLGRPWFFYWLLPYPDTMTLRPQFRSALVWDVFAVFTYATISFLFWYLGLVPDLASLRDRASRRAAKLVYGFLALGWLGSARDWHRYEKAYLLLAGLATPLVVSVHSIVSMDFAIAIVPGWHSTIFPPYFVAGAIFSGFAMVLTLAIPLRAAFRFENLITADHLDKLARLLLIAELFLVYGYVMEFFMAGYGGGYERDSLTYKMIGPYAPAYWLMMVCNVAVPQFLWFRRVRRNVPLLFVISILVNVGMWTERYVIVIASLSRGYLPGMWGLFQSTRWDWLTLLGSFGLFLVLFLLFLKVLPTISIFETRKLAHEEGREAK